MKHYHNILILEAAEAYSVSAIKLLKNKGFLLVAADPNSYAPGLYLADKAVITPPTTHRDFRGAVEAIIQDYDIDIVLPSVERGLEKLKEISANFVTDFDSAIMCKDKFAFWETCQSKGLPIPDTELLADSTIPSRFPKYIKPRYGVGSRDNFVALNGEQFKLVSKLLRGRGEYVIQDLVLGEHWNVDVLVESGNFLRAIPRRDIGQKDGNCIIVEVRDYQKLVDFSRRVQEVLSIKSVFNLEVFEVQPGDFVVGEINVRFGGGVIFGALSGCDIVSHIVTGDDKYLGELQPAIYSRYYSEAMVSLGKIVRYDEA